MKALLLVCIGLILRLTPSGSAEAQSVTRLSPPNISMRGVSIANSSHFMAVGDSATVLTCYSDTGAIATWYHAASPCDKSHTLNGVSYYSVTHAAVVSDGGLIFTTTNTGASWQQSGAGVTGQTLRAITYADALIAVGDSGIILRSTNNGTSWSKIASGTTRSIAAIAINGNGKGYFVGEHGLTGRTTNFGASWIEVTDTIRNMGVNANYINFKSVAVAPAAFGFAIAVGDSGGLAEAKSGVWSAFRGVPSTSTVIPSSTLAVVEIIAKTNYGSACYLGANSDTATWDVFGDNDHWLRIRKSLVHTIDSVTYNRYFIPGDADGNEDREMCRMTCSTAIPPASGVPYGIEIFFTPYEGPWVNFGSGIVQPEFKASIENFLFESIDSLGKGFATADAAIFLKTTDNGKSWEWVFPLSSTAGSNDIATDVHTIDSNNAFAVGWSGNLYRTTDGGYNWDSTNIPAAHLNRLHSIAHPAPKVYVVCGDFGTVLRSTDDAMTWNSSANPSTDFLESIAFSTRDIGVAVGTNGGIIRTIDQGVTWNSVNNALTGTASSYRQVQAFANGTYYATTDSAGLWKSSDHGQSWHSIPNVPFTLGMKFFNESTGVVASGAWSSRIVNDTMSFAFTRDGFATAPISFNVPFVNNDRVSFHFLDSNTFLCFGSYTYVVKVDMSDRKASVTQLPRQASEIQAYPNPSTGEVRVAYVSKSSGPVTIELWDEAGKKVKMLFIGEEVAGAHTRSFVIPNLHGSFCLHVNIDGKASTLGLTLY